MKSEVEQLHDRIYGDGETGDIPRMDNRIRILEEFRWKALAIFSFVVAAINFLMSDGVVSLKHFLGQ